MPALPNRQTRAHKVPMDFLILPGKARETPKMQNAAQRLVLKNGSAGEDAYARVSISSRTLAMNSSTPMGTVSFVRSRTEMLPASTSFSPRISM